MRVGIEECFSSLKRIFDDEVISKNPCSAEHRIRLEMAYYDIIDMAELNSRTGKRMPLPRGRGGEGEVSCGAGTGGFGPCTGPRQDGGGRQRGLRGRRGLAVAKTYYG